MSDPKNLAVFGSFGHGNIGDELVPDCLVALLSSMEQKNDLTVLSRYDGDLIVPGVLGLEASHLWHQKAVSPHILLIGGGIVEPRQRSCLNLAFDIVHGGADSVLNAFAVSVEPGTHFGYQAKRNLRKQLDRLGPVAVRDDLSAQVLNGLAPGHPIQTVGDIGIWTEPGEVPEQLSSIVDNPGIIVIMQPTWSAEETNPWLVGEITTLARMQKLPVTVMSLSPYQNADVSAHAGLVAALRSTAPDLIVNAVAEMVSPTLLDHHAAVALIAKAHLCISSRLHGCVIAFSQRTPFIALAYHPKLFGFTKTVNWERALLPGSLPTRQTHSRYGYRFADLDLVSGDLVAKAEDVLSYTDFSAIDFYRRRQQEVLTKMLAQA